MENLIDVIVIGAGAAGLMAAADLSQAGKTVLVLEARPGAGGRILVKSLPGASFPVHMGAEFIHGQQPLTLQLLQKAKATVSPIQGRSYQFQDGRFIPEAPEEYWEEFEDRLAKLKDDISVEEFLRRYFSDGVYDSLRNSIRSFVQGYDAADPKRASMLALKEEWKNEAVNYRAEGGYLPLVNLLMSTAMNNGVCFRFASTVKLVRWKPGNVEVILENSTSFHGRSAIVTVPLGVLTDSFAPGSISFVPPITEKIEAAREIGYGTVIKFAFKFRYPFWKQTLPDLAFLLSDLAVPTWWLQGDKDDPVLIGWLAGPQAEELKSVSKEVLQQIALSSLAQLFQKTEGELRAELQACYIHNWSDDPYAAGAYSYTLAGHAIARRRLGDPLENTLYFAGEAVYQGPAGGTVEAALQSGTEAALRLLSNERMLEQKDISIANTRALS